MTGLGDFGRLERTGWSEPGTARAYDEDFARASAQCVPATLRAAGAGPGMRALDLCCGPGLITGALVRAGATTTGLDFSPAMLDLAREAVPEATLVEGDAGDLPFDNGVFDIVTIGFGLPHVPDPEAVLAEAHRVLAPGGRIAFSTWRGPEHSFTFRTVFGAIMAHGAPEVALPPGPDANAYADPEIAFPALAAAGFSAPEVEYVESHWTVSDPEAPFHYFYHGTVRGGVLLRAQPEAHLAAIREAIRRAVLEAFGPAPPWTIPIPAAVIGATA